MGRVADGYSVVLPEDPRKNALVRFTHLGRRITKSLRTRDPRQAAEAARAYYLQVVSGRQQEEERTSGTDIDPLLARWLHSLHSTHAQSTVDSYAIHAGKFSATWRYLEQIDTGAIGDYQRARLEAVLRDSVTKERSALASFLTWCKEQRHLNDLPTFPGLPSRAIGVRAAPQREEAVRITKDEAIRILAAFPQLAPRTYHGRKYPLRAYAEALYYTSLRTDTIERISIPEHWRYGGEELKIAAEMDKVRWARTVPLDPRAVSALMSARPERYAGVIFGPYDIRMWFKRAAAAVLDEERAANFAPHDLRHARITHWLEEGLSLPVVQFLAGHTQISTTSKYVRSRTETARQELAERAPAKWIHAISQVDPGSNKGSP
jgi:integrase